MSDCGRNGAGVIMPLDLPFWPVPLVEGRGLWVALPLVALLLFLWWAARRWDR